MLRVGQRAAGWALRLSGPVALLAAAVALFRPPPLPGVGAPPMARPEPAAQRAITITARPGAPAGICTDPAISGCDAYSACMAAVTIGSGLAPEPQRALAEGLRDCAAGAE